MIKGFSVPEKSGTGQLSGGGNKTIFIPKGLADPVKNILENTRKFAEKVGKYLGKSWNICQFRKVETY